MLGPSAQAMPGVREGTLSRSRAHTNQIFMRAKQREQKRVAREAGNAMRTGAATTGVGGTGATGGLQVGSHPVGKLPAVAASVVVKRKGEHVAVVLPGGGGGSKKAKGVEVAEEEVAKGSDNEDGSEDGGGLADLLGDYGGDSEDDVDAKTNAPVKPTIALPPPSSLDLPDWGAQKLRGSTSDDAAPETKEELNGGTRAGVDKNSEAGKGAPASRALQPSGKGKRSVCHDFMQGNCTRGAECRFKHTSNRGGGRRSRKGGKGKDRKGSNKSQ